MTILFLKIHIIRYAWVKKASTSATQFSEIFQLFYVGIYVMLCPIWHHFWYNLKKVKNTHGGVLLVVAG